MLLEAAHQELDVEFTQTLAAADEAGDHDLMGYPSSVAYLIDRLRMSGSRAHRCLKTARAAMRYPSTFAAWKHRHLSSDQADLLFRGAQVDPDRYSAAEPMLLEVIGESFEETKRMLDYWRHRVDPAGIRLELEEQLRRRRFDISRRANGMVWASSSSPLWPERPSSPPSMP